MKPNIAKGQKFHTSNYDDADKHQREENKTHSKVYACNSIHDDEDICVRQLFEAEI